MIREILTHPVTAAQLEEELSFLVDHFRGLGYESCLAAFGGAWAIDYYSVGTSGDGPMPIETLPGEVLRASASGWGGLGANDLFISVPPLPLQFRFCNDSDLHLAFESPCDLADFFRRRWEALGYNPANQKGPTRECWDGFRCPTDHLTTRNSRSDRLRQINGYSRSNDRRLYSGRVRFRSPLVNSGMSVCSTNLSSLSR